MVHIFFPTLEKSELISLLLTLWILNMSSVASRSLVWLGYTISTRIICMGYYPPPAPANIVENWVYIFSLNWQHCVFNISGFPSSICEHMILCTPYTLQYFVSSISNSPIYHTSVVLHVSFFMHWYFYTWICIYTYS